jgi:hypothetical protein
VHPGVAGGTKREQSGRIVAARLTVVDVEPASIFARPATLAGATITVENSVAEAVKAGAGVQGRAVTGEAEAGADGCCYKTAKAE